MSDEKTSPGPWRWGQNKKGGERLIAADGTYVLSVSCYGDCSGSKDDVEAWGDADAALIASAPTLRDQRDRAVGLLRTVCSLLRLEGFHHVVREVETFISEVDVS